MVLHQPDLGAPVLTRTAVASCVLGRWRTTHEAEHGWRDSCASAAEGWAATVFVTAAVFGHAEVAVVTAPGADALPDGARVFEFPWADGLGQDPTVAELVAGTAVDEVVALGNQPAAPDQDVRTQGFLRPVMAAGRLRLLVRPGAGSVLVPFEQPSPTSCCLDH